MIAEELICNKIIILHFYFLAKHVYVVKPIEETHPNSWRRSFSAKEKDILKTIDSGNKVRREVTRTLKSIVKRKYPNIPSYVIKTALFHFCFHRPDVSWEKKDYVDRVFDMLALLQGYLNEKWLPNFFLPKQNLFSDYSDITLENMSNSIKVYWKKTNKIISLLNCEGELVIGSSLYIGTCT